MKKTLFTILLTLMMGLSAEQAVADSFENLKVGEITVTVTNAPPSDEGANREVLTEMRLKTGDTFSQPEFDTDLKNLAGKYQIVDPVITKKDGKLLIHLNITLRPTIVKFTVNGTTYSKKKILDKGELTAPMEYNRGEFYQSITNIRDFLIKRGYFKADVSYKVEEVPGTKEAIAHIFINPGPLGHIHNIELVGFTKKEKSEIYSMIKTSKFNILTNWLTGSGVMKDAEVDRDAQVITHFIQNEGYVDAKVNMDIKHGAKGKLTLFVNLDRGELYHVGKVVVKGNTLETSEELDKALTLKKGDVFSTEKVFSTQEKLKSLYTKQGYLDTSVNYELVPARGNKYNIVFSVEESDKYKVGLIVVSGNNRTNNNVIYNNISLVPGEVFDSSKMKQAQYRLQSTGYFKNVSVYAVKSDHLDGPDSQYRDIMIEVDENRTGAFHLSAGANSTNSIFGEISMTENNFDVHGLTSMWTEGPSALRGGGQFIDVKAMIAAKEQSGTLSWVNPYINDSLWRFGVDFQGKRDNQVEDYNLYSIGAGMSATYPINPYFSGGVKFRIKDSIIRLHESSGNIEPATEEEAEAEASRAARLEASLKAQEKNSGIVSGGGLIFGYNSTDNPYIPHRGIKSNFQAEFAGLVRDSTDIHDFPFLKFGYLNAAYVPLWKNATFKARADFRFIQPLWNGQSEDLPLTEKFFLGGVDSVRGFAPMQIGPAFTGNGGVERFASGDPTGGISSQLFSVELLQKIFQPLDVFAYFDAGSISQNAFMLSKVYMATGVGIRLHMGQPLPFILGWGYPINPDPYDDKKNSTNPQEQRVFFSMAGQF